MKKLDDLWEEADRNPAVAVDIGDLVVCDLCSEDYTNSKQRGGFLFQSKGVCPKCAPNFRASVEKYGETSLIRAEAQSGESFKAFIMRIRGGNNTITIYKGAE